MSIGVRVSIHLATYENGRVYESTAHVANFLRNASWLEIVNELVMSCQDDDVEVCDRPPGFLEACSVVHAKTYDVIMQPSDMRENDRYILCMSTQTLDALLFKHGRKRSQRNSFKSNGQPLESLEELSYSFDNAGTLRHCATNEAVYEIMTDERRAGEIDEIVKAAIFHIQMEMVTELEYTQTHVPLDTQPGEPMEAKSSIFLSSDWRSNQNLLMVVSGGRGVQPGIWSRDLLIQEGLELGSMLPVFRRAKESGFAVIVLNPARNSITIDNKLHLIRQNASPDEHMQYVWDSVISISKAQNVYILAHSIGAKLVTNLMQIRENQMEERVKAIVFNEGVLNIDITQVSLVVSHKLQQCAINFFNAEGNPTLRANARQDDLCCTYIPLDLSSQTSSSSLSNRRSSTNKARTIHAAMDSIFAYFIAARDRGCTAEEFCPEIDQKSGNWLRKLQRLTLKPKKHRASSDGSVSQRFSSASSVHGMQSQHGQSMSRRRPTTSRADNSARSSSFCIQAVARPTVSVSDFELLKVIGRGSIGKVLLVRKVDTRAIYAMKVLRKESVIRGGLQEHIKTEQLILQEINHPFVARLKFSFQTPEKLYLVTDFCSGGELFHHMSPAGFSYELSRFYAAELVLGLEHLHELGVAYRDLKPENILIESSGHIRLTDFGLSKLNVVADTGAHTIVGSPEYCAPEVYSQAKYGFAVDWWSLGVFLHEMLTGNHPFFDERPAVMQKNILTPGFVQQIMPPSMPDEAKSLIFGLLTHDPVKRLGSRGSQDIRQHPFFAAIEWDKLFRREIEPPWKPHVRNDVDLENFDAEILNEPAVDSPVGAMTDSIRDTFQDFTFESNSSRLRKAVL